MENYIRKWSGVPALREEIWDELWNHDKQLKEFKEKTKVLEGKYDELEQELRFAWGICNALLDYLGVDYHTVMVPDLRFAPPQPRVREEIRIKKAK